MASGIRDTTDETEQEATEATEIVISVASVASCSKGASIVDGPKRGSRGVGCVFCTAICKARQSRNQNKS